MTRKTATDMNRRKILKLGITGVAVAGSQKLFPQVASQHTHSKQEHVILRTSSLELTLDSTNGLPLTYRLLKSGIVFHGESAGTPLRARVCRQSPWSFADVEVRPTSHSSTQRHTDFHFAAAVAGAAAVTFTLRYVVQGNSVRITLEDIRESSGFEFISLPMPTLVSVTESDSNAWLAHGDDGGDFVLLRDAHAGTLGLNSFWGKINGVLPVIMTGHSGAVCVQETTAYMDGTLLSVSGEAPGRSASMGTTKVHRVDGSACYDMNLGKGVPKDCGNRTTPNLLVDQQSSCRLDFLEPSGSRAALGWLDGARLVRCADACDSEPLLRRQVCLWDTCR